MSTERGICEIHGDQEFAIACIHICRAIDKKEQIGFHWDTNSEEPRPDAWCSACDKWNADHQDSTLEEWMKVARFQRLCVRCWDEAKRVIGTADNPKKPPIWETWLDRLRRGRR